MSRLPDVLTQLARVLFFGGTGNVRVKLDSPARLVIEEDWIWTVRTHTFDASRRVVLQRFGQRRDRELARFGQLHSVDLRRLYRDGSVVGYTISLRRGWLDNLNIGSTEDDAQASIIAARVSTITGVKVLSL